MKDIFWREYEKLSTEAMNKVFLEKVPLEERMRSVYLPIVAMDCACYLVEDLLNILRYLRIESTKKISRVLQDCVKGYRRDNLQVMRSDLYKYLENTTKEFYSSLSRDMMIFRLQYQQAILDRKIKVPLEVDQLIAVTYVSREIVRFVIRLDRDFSLRLSKLLGENIQYTTEDNSYCLTMVREFNRLLEFLGVPCDLNTPYTDMAFKVFKNKLMNVKV